MGLEGTPRTGLAGLLAWLVVVAGFALTPTSPTEAVLVSLSVLALVACLAVSRLPLASLAALPWVDARHRRIVPTLADRVTDAKRSPRAPRAPGLV